MKKNTNVISTYLKDKKNVYILSTCVEDGEVKVLKARKPKIIPNFVHVYNNSISGIGCSNQMLASYATECKRVKKWYKKFFYHLLNQSKFNFFLIGIHSMHG